MGKQISRETKALMALWVLDEDKAVTTVTGALIRSQGNVVHASTELGIGFSTLKKWIAKNEDLKDNLDAIRGAATEAAKSVSNREEFVQGRERNEEFDEEDE